MRHGGPGSAAIVAVVLFTSLSVVPAPAEAADPTYTLAGHISLGAAAASPGAGEVSVAVGIQRTSSYDTIATVLSDASGNYTIPNLQQASYSLSFTYLGSGNYADIWWSDWPIQQEAPTVYLTATTGPIDVVLPDGGALSGTVTHESDGSPVKDAEVTAFRYVPSLGNPGSPIQVQIHTTTDENGHFLLSRLIPSDYHVRFYKSEGFIGYDEKWGEEAWNPGGDTVTVEPDTSATADHALRLTASVSGAATCDLCTDPNYQYSNPYFILQAWNPDTGQWAQTRNPGNFPTTPTFAFDGLLPATYRINGLYSEEVGPRWGYGFTSTFTLTAGQIVTTSMKMGIPATPGSGVSVDRIAGADRYSVSANISSKNFAGVGTDTVFVASGANFPDALGAGPAAAHSAGSLLLVTPTEVPDAVMVEIQRLGPERIVVIGGPGAVSNAVVDQLNQVPSLTAPVSRYSGASRYETSIETARQTFPSANVVFLATGTNFPDALSAGPAAALRDAPVVIVDGTTSRVDDATAQLLHDLATTEVIVVGGPGAVSDALVASVDALPGIQVTRLSGPDRYSTSAAINAHEFGDPREFYLAVGSRYPDALAGGVLAASRDAPLFVVPPDCVTEGVVQQLIGRRIEKITLLGGVGALAEPAQLFQRC